MTYEGKVYRPWMEANSLLIQVSIGCSNNNCTFCDMFTDKKFRRRSFEDISKDIEKNLPFSKIDIFNRWKCNGFEN